MRKVPGIQIHQTGRVKNIKKQNTAFRKSNLSLILLLSQCSLNNTHKCKIFVEIILNYRLTIKMILLSDTLEFSGYDYFPKIWF